jgi:hypothetical protein
MTLNFPSASTAAGMNQLVPVSGNWCWISAHRSDLRYVLGHGWRFCIVLITIGIYIRIWIYMRQHFRNLALSARSYESSAHRRDFRRTDAYELRSESQTELQDRDNKINVEYMFDIRSEQELVGSPTASSQGEKSPTSPGKAHFLVTNEDMHSPTGTYNHVLASYASRYLSACRCLSLCSC